MISRLLVANRGEIARRVMRSARAMGVSCVAVFSDADAGAPHVAEADVAVALPGRAAADTYLRADALVEAALRSGADAVHPGYGFLSEDARFARAVQAAGLTFVGPPPEVIEKMGSKLAAKATVADAGVPVLPTVEAPEGASDLAAEAARLRWPVLVKASAGGGGRGMRVVENPESLAAALDSARREALSAFGDGTVFLEPYVSRPRHVEVQIVADTHGTITHLFERDCSIQRRHQKLVEECPSPAVDAELRSRIGAAAVRAASAVGYVGVGTVEFLLLEDASFAFLEMNTRLQVEHPVTEAVTGLDLVRLQLLVADGDPLPDEVLSARIDGHAIEVRLYAEDPTERWRPSAGRLHSFSVPTASGAGISLRVDSGVESGSVVTADYDAMLAKVVAHAPTRRDAARALAAAMAGATIHGLTTNRELLVRILRDPEFIDGPVDTGFLDRHDPAVLGASLADPRAMARHAVAATLAAQAARRAQAPVLGHIPSGWRNNPSQPQRCEWDGPTGRFEVRYQMDRTGAVANVEVDPGGDQQLAVTAAGADAVTVESGGVRSTYRVTRHGDEVFVDGPDGSTMFTAVDRFPLPHLHGEKGALTAPLPGTVLRVAVAVGDSVGEGDMLMAIEAMKMEHEVRAPGAGVVSAVFVEAGQQLEVGQVLVTVEEPQ